MREVVVEGRDGECRGGEAVEIRHSLQQRDTFSITRIGIKRLRRAASRVKNVHRLVARARANAG